MRRLAFTFLTGVGVLGAVILGTFFLLHESEPIAPSLPVLYDAARVSEAREAMRADIKRSGGAAAYVAFKETYASFPFEKSHNAAHLFGESLYDIEGIPSVAFCDTSFNFGCYHGFFATAVSAEGLDVVPALDSACGDPHVRGASACQHGLGHGILEYLGHDNLVAALEACGRTNQPDPLAGCTGGVFMEYNVPLVTNTDGSFSIAARPFTEDEGPYGPCLMLTNERFRLSCVQELAQWWNQVFDGDFVKMSELCGALSSDELQAVCIAGVAKIIPSSTDYVVSASEETCALMPPQWYDRCIMQASWSFETNTGLHEEARTLCAFASPAVQPTCPQ